MRDIPRKFCKVVSPAFSSKKLLRSKGPVFLPFYHVVSNNPLPHILNYPIISEKQFENELDFYLRFFNPVSLEEFYNDPFSKRNIFHLSFDDGLKQCAEIIAPILLRKGVPATFFINSGFVDNIALFHRYKASLVLNEMRSIPDAETEVYLKEHGITKFNILQTSFSKRRILDHAAELLELDFSSFLEKEKPYLSTDQIKTLYRQGFSIGAHAHKHPEFWKISEKKQLKHIKKSMLWLTETIRPGIKAFAFPFTDDGVSGDFIRKLKEDNICDITFGTAGLKYDEIGSHFQRYPAEQNGDFKVNLKAEIVYYKVRKLLGNAEVKH